MPSLGAVLVGVRMRVHVVAVAVLLLVGMGVLLTLTRAGGADADDREVGEASLVAEQLPDAIANRVELLWSERSDRAAALAREKLVLATPDERVQPGSVTEVHVPREAVLLERLEVSVHRGEVEPQVVCDVLRRERAGCREQRLQDEPTRGREPQPSAAQGRDRVGEIGERQPGSVGSDGHALSVAQMRSWRRL